MFYAGEIIGIYTIVWAGPVTLRYTFADNKRKVWRCPNYQMVEWMEMKGMQFRKRCRGRDVTK